MFKIVLDTFKNKIFRSLKLYLCDEKIMTRRHFVARNLISRVNEDLTRTFRPCRIHPRVFIRDNFADGWRAVHAVSRSYKRLRRRKWLTARNN